MPTFDRAGSRRRQVAVPNMSIEAVRFCSEGSSFCSYAVNETYLFRFGTNNESAERLH